jgi:hypothetical protein
VNPGLLAEHRDLDSRDQCTMLEADPKTRAPHVVSAGKTRASRLALVRVSPLTPSSETIYDV